MGAWTKIRWSKLLPLWSDLTSSGCDPTILKKALIMLMVFTCSIGGLWNLANMSRKGDKQSHTENNRWEANLMRRKILITRGGRWSSIDEGYYNSKASISFYLRRITTVTSSSTFDKVPKLVLIIFRCHAVNETWTSN